MSDLSVSINNAAAFNPGAAFDMDLLAARLEFMKQDRLYAALVWELTEAYARSALTKGKERHADDEPFEIQPILTISRALGGEPTPLLFQAVKKVYESRRLPTISARMNELHDAMVYLAAACVLEGHTPPPVRG